MTHDPKKIAKLLHQSTLSEEEQDAVITMLPNMSDKQVGELIKVLENDKKEQEKIFAQAEVKKEETLLQMKVEIGNLKEEDLKKEGNDE